MLASAFDSGTLGEMENKDQPLSAVKAFTEQAKATGVYNNSQAANLIAALTLAAEQAKKSGADVETMTVGEMQARLASHWEAYGGQSRASPQSVDTYNGRSKKLLEDFARWNGGDFMAWKRSLAKNGSTKAPNKKAKPRVESESPPPKAVNDDAGPGEQSHVMRLPGNKTARIILPHPITKKEISAVWKLLEAYRGMLETQADVEAYAEQPTAATP